MQNLKKVKTLKRFVSRLRLSTPRNRMYASDWFLASLLDSSGHDLQLTAKRLQVLKCKLHQMDQLGIPERLWQSSVSFYARLRRFAFC